MKKISNPSSSKLLSTSSAWEASEEGGPAGPSRSLNEKKRARDGSLSGLSERQRPSTGLHLSPHSSPLRPAPGPLSPSSFSSPTKGQLIGALSFKARLDPEGAKSKSTKFIERALNRPELATLISEFASKFHDQWGVTGSVALQLHCLHRGDILAREPRDVDIAMAEVPYDTLINALTGDLDTGALKQAYYPDGNKKKYFLFNNELKVDLINIKTKKRLDNNAFETICGVPVVSLSTLKSLKENDKNNMKSSIREKATADLKTISSLELKEPIENFGHEYDQEDLA